MEDKKKWMVKLKELIPGGKLKKDQILIILLAGILLLVIAIPSGSGSREKGSSRSGSADTASSGSDAARDSYARDMEAHLEEVLSQMAGVGDVKVMITLKTSSEKVVEKDVEGESESVTESDSQGGSRTTQNSTRGETTVYDGGSSQDGSPYISKEISPQVEGVVVLASGGNNAVVVQNITEAVQALFGIDTHKIKIMKKN
ncbi:stage III sporulation protein AG, SpoIIIAG [Dorea sp. D27]|nr:stage III sporulation protein AG, SpoIIIAG [Dorea sp. D27]